MNVRDFIGNKKYNGKGYDGNGKKVYELKNGTGYSKEYNDKGRLKFEGEYLNGKRNGKGREFDNNENLIFEGIYYNDKRWCGKGIKNDEKFLIFEGKNLDEDFITMELELV